MILKKKMADGKVKITFILSLEYDYAAVAVVGDFNDWDPHANTFVRQEDGKASTTMVLPAGHAYEFRYLGDGGHWFDEQAADGYCANSFGSGNCLLMT